MILVNSFAFLIVVFFLCILGSFVVLSLMEALNDFHSAIRHPFYLLRKKVAGAEENKAPVPRLLLALLVSKLLAAAIVGAIALYLGASVKTTAIAAGAAFLFLG